MAAPAVRPNQRYFYLKCKSNGRVFPYSDALARRADMEPWVPPKARETNKDPAPTRPATGVTKSGKPDRRFKPASETEPGSQTDLEDLLKGAADAGNDDSDDSDD